jgi:hypothetical protein
MTVREQSQNQSSIVNRKSSITSANLNRIVIPSAAEGPIDSTAKGDSNFIPQHAIPPVQDR